MAKDIFKVDFEIHRWLLKTAKLPPDERGNYIQIICLIYAHNGPIENDAKWLAGQCGCSSRLVRKTVDNLLKSGFLFLTSDGKIHQNKAESVLKVKRTFLETSSKGGRNSAERRAELKKNNDMSSTDNDIPVGTSIPSPPLPSSFSPIQTSPGSKPDQQQRGDVLKNKIEEGKFSIERFLTDDDRTKAKAAAPGWDLYPLMQTYDDNVNTGRFDKPRYPAKAFIAWIPVYTKGKTP